MRAFIRFLSIVVAEKKPQGNRPGQTLSPLPGNVAPLILRTVQNDERMVMDCTAPTKDVIVQLTSTGAYFGPDSSWFWTAIQALVVIGSLIFIAKQIRAQRVATSVAALTSLRDRWDTPHIRTARKAVAAEYPSPNTALTDDHEAILSFFEDVGMLLRMGIFDPKPVWGMYSYYIEHYWPMLMKNVAALRKDTSDKTFYEDAEHLYNECCRLGRKRGGSSVKTDVELRDFAADETVLRIHE